MAALPLTLAALKSPSQESMLSLNSPLISPQCPKADSLSSTINDMDTTLERPSNLTIDFSHQLQKQQHQLQHSNVTPSASASTTTTLHGNISPALSSAGSLSPSFLPEMPQWKRDLIQRRKQNVQRTISASSPTSASSGLLSSSPTITALTSGGLKTSISSSSVRSLVGSNTNIDQLASDGLQQVCSTKDYTKTSLLSFGNTTTKVNKQYNTTTSTCTNTLKPATDIKSSPTLLSSPLKERAEKLFGGQYTAKTALSTFATKEEIATQEEEQQQIQENIKQEYKMMEENFEMCRKTKEILNDETQTTTAFNANKIQKTTRLTGSSYNNCAASSSTTSSSSLKRAETGREKLLVNTTQQYSNNIIGANVNLVNQSLNKCESERLVCAVNTTGNSFNSNNSVTVGRSSVSGNISDSPNNCSNVSNVGKISQKLQENQFIKNEQHLNTKKVNKFKQNTISGGNNKSLDLTSPSKISQIATSNSPTCLTPSSSTSAILSTNCVIKKKMVAVQEMKKSTQNSATHLHTINSTCRANNRGSGVVDTDLNNSEDFSYGPGIVSKLRCRYLSLALRESMEQQRLNKDQLRRSTSLNNLLDNTEDEENCDDEEPGDINDEDVENRGFEYKSIIKDKQTEGLNNEDCASKKVGILKSTANNGQDKRFSNNAQGSNGVGVTFTETAYNYNKRSRHLKRGNDSLKRARSVEALLSEKSPWHSRTNSCTPTSVTIEDKIHNARERLHQGSDHMPPKRLTSIIDDTERPPPDLVKQTLKMFEATANRRPGSTNRSNSKGDVASKVEKFKNIIKEQKPVVTFPKPLSPTKKIIKPLSLKTSTPQANDLLQSPLGRKTMAAATSVANTNDCLTPSKTNNTLSDHTPDIIPRQKLNTERDFKQNKEIFSSKEKFLANEREFESPQNNIKRGIFKEKYEVDSPLTALTKEMTMLKLIDSTPPRKSDNSANVSSSYSSDNCDIVNNMGSVDGVGSGDACQRHKKYPYNNSNDFVNETAKKELNISSLKNENDKIINKTKSNINIEAISSSPPSTTIETKNEASGNNYNDSLLKASSPPPSSSELSDVGENYDDDENGGLKITKRITRTALDNIAKAGYTQEFKFNTITSQNNSSSSALTTGKQIGMMRPLLNTQEKQQQKPKESNMETLKHSSTTASLTSQEIEKNRINDLKKSSISSGPCNVSPITSSPSASLDHQVIKPLHTSSPATASPVSSANNSASGFNADVDSVICATNSPLWAMRKRRQTPPVAPDENTTMVFNFSNRKEVPDYIENDGVIFRRKRELPKPNESGFVLLGDLSVETSTDMDYDDFSMCPPSPCDVEFVNANIVIDGKSSIRQKSKDATFRVQFNDTLTSTFEYPSEASLIVDESFSAYNESYTQPIDCSALSDGFMQAFQELNLEGVFQHHVADEIIQLPTLNSSSPAAAATNTDSPTKNILGNLPLDYPDLQKGIQLTTATTPSTQTATDNNDISRQTQNTIDKKKSRKDLMLPLGLGLQMSLQKPSLPVKRHHIMNTPTPAGLPTTFLHTKNSATNLKTYEDAKQQIREEQNPHQLFKNTQQTDNAEVLQGQISYRQRKKPQVLNNPQYACFLQETNNCLTKPIQRSRSNEFQNTSNTLSVSATVSRSNSLRNLEYVPAKRANSAVDAATFCFSTEVNSNDYLNITEMAKDPNALKSPPMIHYLNRAKENPPQIMKNNFDRTNKTTQSPYVEPHDFSQSLNNLTENYQSITNLKKNVSRSVDSLQFSNLKMFADLGDQSINSLENFDLSYSQHEIASNEISRTTEFNFNASTQNSPSQNAIHLASSLNGNLSDGKSAQPNLKKDARKQGYCENIAEIEQLEESKQNIEQETNEQVLDLLLYETKNPFVTRIETDLNLSRINYENNLTVTENWPNSALESQLSFDLEKNVLNNTVNSGSQLNSTNSTLTNTKTAVGVSLIVNSKYVTDYKSKITKNLSHTDIKVKKENFKCYEDLITRKTPDFPRESQKTKLYEGYFQDNNLIINEKSKHLEHKSLNSFADNASSSPSKEVYNLNQNVSNETLSDSQNKYEDKVNDNNKLSCKENLKGKSKSADALNLLTSNSKDFSKNRAKSLNDVKIDDDNKSRFDEKNNFAKRAEILTKSTHNFETTFPEQFKQKVAHATSGLTSLQMSLDSLDQYEDAEDKLEEKSLTDLEAIEVLDDIAIGFNTSSLLDFNKLLSLKKSKTAFCLQTLEKSFSLESEDNNNSVQDDDVNFESACNTLESKCSLKPIKTLEMAKMYNDSNEIPKAPEVPLVLCKKPKTLRLKTTEKILNFTNKAAQNVSNYNSFCKSKNFCRNASKSFKNSLKFYETFSEKSTTTGLSQSSMKRSTSLPENPTKQAELNRKIFAKSNKIMRKVKNVEEYESPTENSYSFEYFEAENGNLNKYEEEYSDDIGKGVLVINENESKMPELPENEQAINENKGKNAQIKDINSNDDILFTEKTINIKPVSTDFYFNTSPRPFKRFYEATTVVDVEDSFQKHLQLEKFKDKICTAFAKPHLTDELSNTFNLCDLKGSCDKNGSTLATRSLPNESEHLSNQQRANSFSAIHKKRNFNNNNIIKSDSFNTFSRNVYQKVETFNRNSNNIDDSFTKSNNDLNKLNNNSQDSSKSLQINTCSLSPHLKIKMLQKSAPEIETFMRNDDSNRFSFNLTKFSNNSGKLVDNSPVKGGVTTGQTNSSAKNLDTVVDGSSSPAIDICHYSANTSFNRKCSSNSLGLSKFEKYNNTYNNATTTTISSPKAKTATTTTTLTLKDFNKTTNSTTLTNFPTKKVVDKNNFNPSTISYRNSSFSSSSLRTTNKSYTTAKYQQNPKATTTMSISPAAPLKSLATINPPKVMPRRLIANAPNRTKTANIASTSCDTTSSSATSSTRFKASSTCYAANNNNNNVAPLRRRIPGNTLYYV